MAAKPIKSLELHYTMIHFLINIQLNVCSGRPVTSWVLALACELKKKNLNKELKNEVSNPA